MTKLFDGSPVGAAFRIAGGSIHVASVLRLLTVHLILKGTNMARIHFYGKPDCINNRKQKELLTAAGHELIDHDLLQEEFTTESLRVFFEDRPVADWFNPTAPAITSGNVHPEQLDEHEALALMLDDHLLVRRPLIRIDTLSFCGFDTDRLKQLIDFKPVAGNKNLFDQLIDADLVTCPRIGESNCTTAEGMNNG